MGDRSHRRALTLVVTAAVVAGVLVSPVAATSGLPRAVAAGPVSGAIGLGGGLSGTVDERTGLFSVSVPVMAVTGPGSAGVSWSLVWDQGRAVDGVDRSGFGEGWSLGVSFIDPATPTTVFPANGGAYTAGGTYASGLVNYPQQDLVFEQSAGEFAYQLSYDDGRVDGFDENGNLVSRTDRFGNHTQLSWEAGSGEGQWRPSSIVDGYGLETTFSYPESSVVVTAPARSDGVVASTTITLDDESRVTSVTDPSGATAEFVYAPVSGSTVPLLTQVVSASQATTWITYQSFGDEQPGLTAVQSVVTTDADENVLGPARLFSMDPPQNDNGHNYTGFPTYQGGTSDGLFESGDADYFYTTAISSCVVDEVPPEPTCPGSPISTLSTYDSQHRLVARAVMAGEVTVQEHTSTYTPVRAVEVDPNYARPTSTSVTYRAASSTDGVVAAAGARTVTTSRVYDDHGRVSESTDETGTTTTFTYDQAFGLITGVTITGADGSGTVTTHTLSADGKSIVEASTAYTAPGQPLAARSTTSYSYDATGQLTKRIMTWAPGAKPPGDSGGPDTVTTTFESNLDTGARTRTITTTTAAGTAVAEATTTVLDLVTGRPMRHSDPLGRVTRYGYDAAGRRTSRTSSDGLTTTSAYQPATATSPPTRSDTSPDGRVVLTTYDALGRRVRITDNVHDQAFTSSPTARQLSTFEYSLDGTQVTATDQHGRSIVTTLDVLGRQVAQVGATGLTHSTIYDDAAHTITQSVAGAGETTPQATRTTSYDDGNRTLAIDRVYSDGTADPPLRAAYDGLGRVTSHTSEDLTLEYSYVEAGVVSTAQTVTPQDPVAFPGDPLNLSGTLALGGQPTTSDRNHSGGTVFDGTALSYDPAGRVATSTDPIGRTTSFTYHPDGQVATRTTPSGTVVTDTYDPATGRLSSVLAQASAGPAVTHTYGYVRAGEPGAGRVHTISDGTDTVTLGYDADGHIVSRAYSDGTATSATYSDTGLLTSTTDVTGAVTSYDYDSLGRMTSATQTRDSAVLASVTYSYDAMSRITTTTRGNGVVTTNSWTPRHQLAAQRTTTASGALVEEHAYSYDSHGNVATRTDTVPAVSSAPTTAGTWTTVYRYDAYNRLLSSATYPGTDTSGTPSTSTSYTVNAAGDVTGVDTGSTTTNTIDPAGQLTAQTNGGTVTTQSFDADGRITRSLQGWEFNYDGFNRMLTATRNGTTATYAYWPDGSRRATTTTSPQPAVCDQAISEAGTGEGTYGRYKLVQAPAVGGSGSQVVVGTSGADHLVGGSGDDVLCGLGGDDMLVAGSGDDVLDGGADDDNLIAGSGDDLLDGAAGSDRLFGGSGNDVLRNGEVNHGGSGRDEVGGSPPAATTTQTFHYGPDGTLVNDTTADATTGTTATTASYLLTGGREARTLQPGTTSGGIVPADAVPAPITTGTGTGYLLRDRHSSVTALIDHDAAVTNTYHYGDYGPPAGPDGQPQPTSTPTPGGRSNPFQYTGATPTASMTDPTTGLLLLPARSYDPTQGRFTSRDTASVFNKYQGFSTNPIINLDPTGHFSLEDLLVDIGTLILFTAAAIATGGAALAAAPALIGAEVAAVTTTTVVTTVATAVTAVASATGAVASAVKAADDIDDAVTNNHFLTNDQRNALSTVQAVAGAVSAVSGLTAMGGTLEGAGEAADEAADFLETNPYKRFAYVEGDENGSGVGGNVNIPRDGSLLVGPEPPEVSPGDAPNVEDGVSGGVSEPQPIDQAPEEEVPDWASELKEMLGGYDAFDVDEAIFDENPDLTTTIHTAEAEKGEVVRGTAETISPTSTAPRLAALDGSGKEIPPAPVEKPTSNDWEAAENYKKWLELNRDTVKIRIWSQTPS